LQSGDADIDKYDYERRFRKYDEMADKMYLNATKMIDIVYKCDKIGRRCS